MSDTPQNDIDIETNNPVPDSETGGQVQAGLTAQVEQVEANQAEQVDEAVLAKQKANEAFNKQYGEKKQLERELEASKARVAEFEQKQREAMQASVSEVPPLPDPFDDDYEAKIKSRDEALRANERFNAEQQAQQQQQQLVQQQAAQAKQVEFNASIETYTKKAISLGIEQSELQAAGTAVANYGLSDDLVMHILKDSDGPLITKHLAANPQDGYQLATMSPYAVGGFIENIKSKAGALKPKQTNAPKPPTQLQGKSADPSASKYKHISGVTYS